MTDTRTRPPLAIYRKAAGLSQQALGDHVGVHQATVCFYESGRGTPTLALALAIAARLGQPVETLWATLLPAYHSLVVGDGAPTHSPKHQPREGASERAEAHQDAAEICGVYGNASISE